MDTAISEIYESREPAPDSKDTRVQIGDVGFIREGGFHLLFSAGSPLGERIRGEDVPSTFEPLAVGTPASKQPRRPGCVGTHTVQQVGTNDCAPVTTELALEADAEFSFELTGYRGAALVTRHQTYKKDSRLDSAFRKYTAHHYKSWVKFARDKQYGENLQPVLVYGFDMTRDFAMAAYSHEGISDQSDANHSISVPMFGSSAATFWLATVCVAAQDCQMPSFSDSSILPRGITTKSQILLMDRNYAVPPHDRVLLPRSLETQKASPPNSINVSS
ncbi:hypothetical protein BJ322DRAFT_494418 [Thelephora terrestris]|uniref:Uncharacterized protein n=1 Tax=Thelephora terrestris TaxID=56493 RepID=A0A9P6H3E1_9AGAM|nr:hypothetical protein BJ322DRAFT_494418 [Thelephora terrestris]